ncbi:MAG TPA: sigma-54 dependent transcriptional regulator [Polyangiales bacterium]|nr:sigma-54 dependent transcriptional regulator [Polyangiales bacterium]
MIVEDDPLLRHFVSGHLIANGWEVTITSLVREARQALSEKSYRLVLTDVFLPDGSGFDLLQSLKKLATPPAVIVMSGDTALDHAISAVRHGATDFLVKPFSMDALDAALSRVHVRRKLSVAPPALLSAPPQQSWRERYAPDVLGSDPSLLRVFSIIERVADSDCSVMITGESGTGKELIARAVHDFSDRRDKPFMAVNCAAIPETLLESELFGHTRGAFTGAQNARVGRFAAADGGTIFLDEIGEMPIGLQAKILRLLQEKEVTPLGESKSRKIDVRVVAATNKDLDEMVRDRSFREDLLYRLNVIPIELPALRHRKSDVPELVRHFLARANQRRAKKVIGISQRALDLMCEFDWPGNVRQLENTVQRMVLLKVEGELGVEDLPDKMRSAQTRSVTKRSPWDEPQLPPEGLDLREAIEAFESSLIRQALERVGWNKNRAAALLQMNRTTLVEKLKKKGFVQGDEKSEDG